MSIQKIFTVFMFALSFYVGLCDSNVDTTNQQRKVQTRDNLNENIDVKVDDINQGDAASIKITARQKVFTNIEQILAQSQNQKSKIFSIDQSEKEQPCLDELNQQYKINLFRQFLFQQYKRNQYEKIQISDQDLYKEIDKFINNDKPKFLKEMNQKFNQKFANQKFQSKQQRNKAFQAILKGMAAGAVPLLIQGLLVIGVYTIGLATVYLGGFMAQGGILAGLQAIGAAGIGVLGLPVVLGAGAVAGVGYGLYSYYAQQNQKK